MRIMGLRRCRSGSCSGTFDLGGRSPQAAAVAVRVGPSWGWADRRAGGCGKAVLVAGATCAGAFIACDDFTVACGAGGLLCGVAIWDAGAECFGAGDEDGQAEEPGNGEAEPSEDGVPRPGDGTEDDGNDGD